MRFVEGSSSLVASGYSDEFFVTFLTAKKVKSPIAARAIIKKEEREKVREKD